MKRLILAAMLATGLAGAAQADDALKAAIAGEHRSAANKARDVYRHPYETLSFFGIKPNMTVVELSPSGGWYTEILAPYLRDKGKLIGAGEAIQADKRYGMAFKKKLDSNPAVFDKVVPSVFEPPATYQIAPPNSVDMVLTFRNLHNWVGNGEDALRTTFKEIHKVLKPGGVLGVVEHRARADVPATDKSGYVGQQQVIAMAQAAGFVLDGSSEVNANPRDTKDHPNGVWTLPPVNRHDAADDAKYKAIGESDRMTLRFVKPRA